MDECKKREELTQKKSIALSDGKEKLKLLQMAEKGMFSFSLTSPNQRRRQLFCC
jgi:hypothetical protein